MGFKNNKNKGVGRSNNEQQIRKLIKSKIRNSKKNFGKSNR